MTRTGEKAFCRDQENGIEQEILKRTRKSSKETQLVRCDRWCQSREVAAVVWCNKAGEEERTTRISDTLSPGFFSVLLLPPVLFSSRWPE